MKFKFSIGSLLLICLNWCISYGQCPTNDFILPATACLNELVTLTNTSSPGEYQWDFCSGDFDNVPSAELAFTISAAVGRPSIEFANDNGKWYGFATGTYTNTLFRMEFANGTDQPVTASENLGSLGGVLNGPGKIVLLKEGNDWYGLLYNTVTEQILKLSFGTSLANPITTSVLVSGVGSFSSGMAVGRDETNGWICVIANSVTNQFTIIRLGATLSSPGSGDILTSATVPNANNLGDVDLIFDCGTWYGYAVNFGNGNLYRLDFGTDLFQAPAITEINGTDPVNAGRIRIVQEGEDYFVLITALSGNFYKVVLGSSLDNPSPVVINEGNFGSLLQNSFGLAVAKENSMWTIAVLDMGSGKVSKINYPNLCAVTILEEGDNPVISYSATDIYAVSLTTTLPSGFSTVLTKTISINSLPAPDISFTSQNICANNDVNFTSQNLSGDITTYDWDFGDASAHSPSQDPVKQFSAPGNYQLDLLVTASNGCKNHAYESIKIYSPPSATFSTPSGLVCTNNEFIFTNGVTDNYDGNLSYQWLVENNPVSTDRDLKHTFITGGDYDVTLQVSIPGCSDDQTLPLNNVQVGPVVGFSQTGQCESDQVSFTNLSSGDISGYEWNFGNGNNSTVLSPVQTYSTKGVYTVSLETTGANGCVSATSKQVTIYSKPQPDFSIELPPFSCSGTPSQFTNTSPNPTDSNIASWAWQFGDDANGTAVDKDPLHTFSMAGEYNVTLTATTNFNCSSTITNAITISQGPLVSFTNTPACANQGTRFSDGSGSDIKSWFWTMGNSTYAFSNPTHVFSSPGDYNVQLTVTANNDCVATLSKTITVPVAPVLDFSFLNACEGLPATFQDTSPLAADPVASRSWDFAGEIKNGSPVQYSFASAGTYDIKMTSTQLSGCVYSISKNVIISPTPVAKFSSNPEWGTPPLSVQFTNQSTGANTYLWRFNDKNGSTSTNVSPGFQFTDLGDYVVDLVATNTQGCSNTVSSKISVIIPSLDLELKDLNLIKDPASGSYRIMVTIKNRSNFILTSADVIVDISGKARIKESITTTILPDGEVSQLLTNQIVPGSLFTYLCAELDVANDLDLFNNKKCESVSDEGVIFSPYPNPSNGEFQFDWISFGAGDAHFAILNSTGQEVFQQDLTVNASGLNQAQFDLSSYQTGIYFFKFSSGSLSKTTRIMILR